MDFQFSVSLIVSTTALVLSILSFRRNRRLENENHIYRLKIDTYSGILRELNKLINCLQENLINAKSHLKNPTQESEDNLDEIADSVDGICIAFDDFIVSNSLVIPEKILYALNSFSEKILNTDPLDDESIEGVDALNKFQNTINEVIKEANEIGILLRKDLHIEQINTFLHKRLK